jgi:hypothetical protein
MFEREPARARNDPWFDQDMTQLATLLSQWVPLRTTTAVGGPPPLHRLALRAVLPSRGVSRAAPTA